MTTDATHVTGSPLAGGARAGDVFAERYELLEALDADGPSLSYRALDHETERQVLVRTLAGGPLDERTLAEVLERLRGLVGVGGRYLSSLLDADREGRRPFTIEAWPSGTQLSAIIDARRARGDALSPREVLPVLARLVAALAALPDPWHHGDVRAERVWVDTDGLRLTGAYLLAALPPRMIADRVADLGPAAMAYAPELAAGRSGPAADRWGVAAITWEALTSRAPELSRDPPELAPNVRVALRRLLDPEPGRRAADLSALLEALAAQASLAVPRLDPEPHRPPTADIGAPPARTGPPRARAIAGAAAEGTQEISFDQIVEERALPKKIAGAAPDGTQEIAFDDIVEEEAVDGEAVEEEASADDTAKHAAISSDEQGLDPRLVRAALGITLESESGLHGPDSLDPRLVRAALGVTSEDVSDVEELPSDELEVVDDRARRDARAARPAARTSPAAKMAPAASARSGPSAPRAAPAPRTSPAPRPSAPAASGAPRTSPAPRPAAPAATPAPRASATPIAPAPAFAGASSPSAPRPRPAPLPSASSPTAGASAPRPSPAPRASGPAPSPAARTSPAPQAPQARREPHDTPTFSSPAARGEEGGTAVVQRPEDPPPRTKRRSSVAGPLIVIAAVVLAIAIVGAGFLIRSMITRERDSAERSRHIQERLQQIRSEEGASAP